MDPYLLARFLHIFFAAAWFGLSVGAGQKALSFARVDPAKAQDPSASLRNSAVIGSATGLATMATGFWLMIQLGGWEAQPLALQLGANLAIVIFVIGLWPIGRGWAALARERAKAAPRERLDALAGRIGLWSRGVQLLWICVLATMVLRHL